MSEITPRGRRAGLGALPGTIADAVIAGMDLNALVGKIDVDELLERADVNRLLERIDVNRLLDRVDPDRLLDRVDNDRLLDRVDPDRLLDRVDVNRLMDRIDVDRLLDRVAIDEIVRRAGIAEIVRDSTGQVAGSALDVVRRQIVSVDIILMRVVGGVLLRGPARLRPEPAREGPVGLVDDEPVPVRYDGAGPPVEMSGRYAGILTRALAYVGDVALATAVFTTMSALLAWVASTVLSLDIVGGAGSGPVWLVGLAIWSLLYFWGTLSLQGRTPVMALLGLRLVTRQAEPMSPRRVLVWVLFQALSAALFGVGFFVMLLDRERRTLHDRIAGGSVIYDWGARAAVVASPLGRWIEQHGPAGPGER